MKPMVPSAEERRSASRKAALKQWDAEQHDKPWPAAADIYLARHEAIAIEQAYRDGFDACLALLREPSEQLQMDIMDAIEAHGMDRPTLVLRAAADAIDSGEGA
jgi:hypothetical protein